MLQHFQKVADSVSTFGFPGRKQIHCNLRMSAITIKTKTFYDNS